jgi:peptidoglycan/LPS O-acetylase OafA/YrhL
MSAVVSEPVRPARVTPSGDSAHAQRSDIQGLRALAVGLVLVYHLMPDRLPGGFAGVDVFFVISGFLIIGLLTRQMRRTGQVRLIDFYARRIKRLIPAATVVLLAVVAGTLVLLPIARWPAIMREVAASALNVQNWLLAFVSADYAHATAAASPVQHYWSLSVEEQFYLVIPLVLLLSAVVARGKHTMRWVFASVAVITAASLLYSALATSVPPAGAYFITPTRMWELGLGGLTAMVAHRVRLRLVWRLLLGWGGLTAVVLSAFVLSTGMAFPGWIALLPTLGTVAVIVAGIGTHRRRGYEAATLLGLQPLRYLGDISYSLYLWHWPVIVFVLERSGGDHLTLLQGVKVLAASLILAVLTKHGVEDPFRKPRRRRLRTTYFFGAGLVAVSLAATAVPWPMAQGHLDALVAASKNVNETHPDVQAARPGESSPTTAGAALTPDPAIAEQDMAAAWSDGCATTDLKAAPAASDKCVYGNKQAPKTMVLVGDSHMTMFSTPLIRFAESNRAWRVKLLTHDGCAFGDLPPDRSGYPLRLCADKAYELVSQLVAMKPDLVVTTGYTLGDEVEDGVRVWPRHDEFVAGYRKVLSPLAQAGIPIAAIHDVPHMTTHTPRCLQRNPGRSAACDATRDAAVGRQTDPLIEAVQDLPGTRTVDLTDWLCTPAVCPAVVGNVVVYRDNHLTDTYARTLTGPLVERLGLN